MQHPPSLLLTTQTKRKGMLHVTDTETNFQVITCELAIASYNSRSQVISCDRKLQVALASYKSRSKVISRDRKL